MYCIRCGNQLQEKDKFCGKCGYPVGGVQMQVPDPLQTVKQTAVQYQQMTSQPVVREKKRISKPLIISGIIAAVLVALGIAFVALGGPDKLETMKQLNLGKKYLEELDYDNAIAAFEEAIEIEPNSVKAYLGLAQAYVGLEDYESAINILNDGIDITDSDELREYRDEVQAQWDDVERRFCGFVYAVDTDLDDSNNRGISGAYVYVTDADDNTEIYYTDENGWYETGHMETGTYSLYFYADGYIGRYEEIELNSGKCTYNAILDMDTYTTLYGSVQVADEDTDYSNNYPLEDVEITMTKLNGDTSYSADAKTDGNGQYEVTGLRVGVYEMSASKPGYITLKQRVVIYEGQEIAYNTMIELIPENWNGRGTASGTIYDAVTGNGVDGLTLDIREGINNTEGNVIGSITTGDYGYYETPELKSGNYCIEVTDHRENAEKTYFSTVMNIKILGGINIDSQDGTVSDTIATGQVRIVLTWGATPWDLDSHLFCEMDNGESYHIYYSDKTFYSYRSDAVIADLDLDDTSSYGPETTTIYTPEAGDYTFGVYNFTGDSDYSLANSGACVQVYMGYSNVPSYVFYVPHTYGYYWEVFRYNSENGMLTPLNGMYEDY